MGKLNRLLIAATVLWSAATSSATLTSPAPDAACEDWEALAGACGGTNNGDHIELFLEIQQAAPPLLEQAVIDDVLVYGSDPDPSPEPAIWDLCSPTNPNRCFPTAPAPAAPAPGPIVTLRDIASFVPAAPAGDMQPRGWAVRNLPANFIADASTQIITGTLLGQPADVRFTPVGYRWTHSDGGIVESSTPGATWEGLGLREFTATDTSHRYDESGRYTVTLDIVLRAEYRFAGSDWRPIAGTLTTTSDPQPVLVGQIDTVLVDSDCIQNPAGPGC